MQNYDDIFYLDHPHFTVGKVDQWGEEGYFLYDGLVYAYEENRKDQCGETHSPLAVRDFLAYAESRGLEIPEDFKVLLMEAIKV